MPWLNQFARSGVRVWMLLTTFILLQAVALNAQSSPARIIADYYRAVGGYTAIKHVRTRRMYGTYVEGSLHATTDILWQRPALRRVNVHAPGFEYSEGFDGRTWEYNHTSQKAVLDTGEQADIGRRGAEFDESFVDYRARGNRVDFIGSESLADKTVAHLRVTLADGFAKEYYFDRRTHLIVAVGKAMRIHARGEPVRSLTYYEDWRRDGGLLQPHSFVEKEVGTGKVLNTLHWDRIVINAPISPDEIGNPDHKLRARWDQSLKTCSGCRRYH